MPSLPLSMYNTGGAHRGSRKPVQQPFYILGLPRSKTYWLSRVLGCRHEHYSEEVGRQFTVSSVDTNPYMCPTVPMIKVWRDVPGIVDSCLRSFDVPPSVTNPHKFYTACATSYLKQWSNIQCTAGVFKFEDLHNPKVIKAIGKLVGVDVDVDLYMDQVLNIQDRQAITKALPITAKAMGITEEQLIHRMSAG